jgi:hypothetical protein
MTTAHRRLLKMNRDYKNRVGVAGELDDRLQSYEMAFRMQSEAPAVLDLSGETEETLTLYGYDEPKTKNFAHQLLLARRFSEAGTRFVQVSHAGSLPFNNEQWDQHSHIKQGHEINVGQIHKPITGFIKDLRRRGLLDETLVLWGESLAERPPRKLETRKRLGVTTTQRDSQCLWPVAA